MATEAAIAKRRAEAEGAISDSVSALAQKFGIGADISPVPGGVRDIELRRVMQLESVAEALSAIARAANGTGAGADKSAGDFPEDFPAQARARLIKLGVNYADIKKMSREELIELDGIAEKTADEILAFVEKK